MTSPIRLNSSGAPYLTDLPAPNIAHIAYQDIAVRDIGDTITILYSTKKRELVNGINRIFGTNLVWNELQERAHTFFHPEISSVFISFTFENVGEYFIAQKVTNTDVLPKVAKTAISVYEMATKNARPTEDTVYYTTPKNAGIFTNFLESQFCTQEMLFSPTYNTHFYFVLLPNNDFLTPVILQYHGDDNGYVTLLFKDEIIPAIDLNMSVYNRPKALITLATTLQVPKSGIDFTGQNTIKVFDPITGVNSKYTVFCMKRDNESKYMAVGEAIVAGTPISPPPPPVPTTPTPAPEQGGSLTGLHADYSGTGWYKATDTGTVFCKDVPEGETARFEEGGVVYVSVYTKADARLYSSRAATSNLTDMSVLFSGANDFNQDISSWDVSNVENMGGMFSNAFAFNQDISGWDVSQVTDMSYMFYLATSFNQDLSGWNVFYIPPIPDSFDDNAEWWSLPRPVWETSGRYPSPPVEYGPTGLAADYPGTGWYKATDTGTVFCKDVPEGETKRFELGGTNFISVTRQSVDSTYPERAATSNLTEMANLFNNRWVQGDITTWDVSNVTSMSNMFYSSWGFDQPIGNWNVGQVTDMSNMFNKCRDFNQDISGWNVNQVTDMSNMFNYCEKFNQDLSNWDVGNVTDMTGMFKSLDTFNQDLSRWNVLNIPTQPDAFDRDCFDWTLPKPVWGTDGTGEPVEPVEPGVTYHPTGLHADYPGTGWYRASDTGIVFCKDVPNGETGQFEEGGIEYVSVYSASSAKYSGARAATSNVTDMNSLFANNTTFNEDISSWDVSNVTLMYGMFRESPAFNADISNWDVSNVTNMYMMFRKCTSFNQDLSGWNVGNVTDMSNMFYYCTSFNQDLSGWNVANIPTLPNHFDTNTIAWTLPKPVWGTTGITPT